MDYDLTAFSSFLGKPRATFLTSFLSLGRSRAAFNAGTALASPVSPNSLAARKRVVHDELPRASMSMLHGLAAEIEERQFGALPNAPMGIGHGLEQRHDGFPVQVAAQEPGAWTRTSRDGILEQAAGHVQDAVMPLPGRPQRRGRLRGG